MSISDNFINPPGGPPHPHTKDVDQYKISDINRHLATGITTGVPATHDISPASLLSMYPPGFDPSQIVASHQDHRGGHNPPGPSPGIYTMADGTTWKLDRTGSIFRHTQGGPNGQRIDQFAVYQGSWLPANHDERPIVNGAQIRDYVPGDPKFTGLNGFAGLSGNDPEADAAARATLAAVNSINSHDKATNDLATSGAASSSGSDDNQNSDTPAINGGTASNAASDSGNDNSFDPNVPIHPDTSEHDMHIVSAINRHLASGISTGVPASGDPHPASLLIMYPPGFDPSQIVASHQDHRGSTQYPGPASSIYKMADGTTWKLDRTGSIFRHTQGGKNGPRIDQYAIYQGDWFKADSSEKPIVNGSIIRDYRPGDPAFIGTPGVQHPNLAGPTAPTSLNNRNQFPPETDILGGLNPGDHAN